MSIALERFFWTVLLMMPYAVELLVLSSAVSCSWPISESGVRVTVPSLAFTKTAPNFASATEDTTCLSTVVWQRSGPLVRGLVDELFLLPMKK
jgi:hypothetical protein